MEETESMEIFKDMVIGQKIVGNDWDKETLTLENGVVLSIKEYNGRAILTATSE